MRELGIPSTYSYWGLFFLITLTYEIVQIIHNLVKISDSIVI